MKKCMLILSMITSSAQVFAPSGALPAIFVNGVAAATINQLSIKQKQNADRPTTNVETALSDLALVTLLAATAEFGLTDPSHEMNFNYPLQLLALSLNLTFFHRVASDYYNRRHAMALANKDAE